MQQALRWIANYNLPRPLRLLILAINVLILVAVTFSSLGYTFIGAVVSLVCLDIGFWFFLSGRFLAKIVKIAGFAVYMVIFMALYELLQATKTNGNPLLVLVGMLILGVFVFCAIMWGSPWLNKRATNFEAKHGPGLYQANQGE
jgi:hypothetical protein